MSGPLSVAMIVQDESDCLETTLISLAPLRDYLSEVVLVDGGSTDCTKEVAARTCLTWNLPLVWIDRHFDNFKNQKNVALKACSGRWILALDADMVVNAPVILRKLLAGEFDNGSLIIDFALFFARGDLRHYCTASTQGMPTTRLIRNGVGISYQRDVHEFPALDSEPTWEAAHNGRVSRSDGTCVIVETSMLKSDWAVRNRVERYRRFQQQSAEAGIPIFNMALEAEHLIAHRWEGAAQLPQAVIDGIYPPAFETAFAKGFPK